MTPSPREAWLEARVHELEARLHYHGQFKPETPWMDTAKEIVMKPSSISLQLHTIAEGSYSPYEGFHVQVTGRELQVGDKKRWTCAYYLDPYMMEYVNQHRAVEIFSNQHEKLVRNIAKDMWGPPGA